jgi:hypothetical protein
MLVDVNGITVRPYGESNYLYRKAAVRLMRTLETGVEYALVLPGVEEFYFTVEGMPSRFYTAARYPSGLVTNYSFSKEEFIGLIMRHGISLHVNKRKAG